MGVFPNEKEAAVAQATGKMLGNVLGKRKFRTAHDHLHDHREKRIM